jgi:hypothetical protein
MKSKLRFFIAGMVMNACVTGFAFAKRTPIETPSPKTELGEMPNLAMVTLHRNGRPRDPVNVILVGDREAVLQAMGRAGWALADPHTMRRVMEEAACILEHRSYPDAPISHSFLFNRREDLAFECQVGGSPKRRHHIRLWETPFSLHGVPVWAGAATYDRGIKIFKFDHKVEKNVDVERDYLMAVFKATGGAREVRYLPGWDSEQLKKCCGFISDGRVVWLDLWPGEKCERLAAAR